MKISELVKALTKIREKHGNLYVLFQDPNSDKGPYSVNLVSFREVEDEDEYPADFDMPKGFKFVEIQN